MSKVRDIGDFYELVENMELDQYLVWYSEVGPRRFLAIEEIEVDDYVVRITCRQPSTDNFDDKVLGPVFIDINLDLVDSVVAGGGFDSFVLVMRGSPDLHFYIPS